MSADYSTVTETPGGGATQRNLDMLYARYAFAAGYCEGRDVLEVACGPGPGLGYLARKARRVVGGDYTESLARLARQHYAGRLPVLRLDAHDLPFSDQSFDVVILFEAVYYLRAFDRFLGECRRLLRRGGVLLICEANPERPDFNPSPFSVRYYSAAELRDVLGRHGFDVEMLSAFPVRESSRRAGLIVLLRRGAVALHLIPKTMKGKAVLKRLVYGKLKPFPAEVTEGMAAVHEPVPLPGNAAGDGYEVIYAVARAPRERHATPREDHGVPSALR
ncbi:MAG: class I SAM-dependent methyltransferase [Candidatus Rokubacteria bacterium]|nr:class I SAM-dependent methyltransferase [Candidatus Rokubacteria bacterium]